QIGLFTSADGKTGDIILVFPIHAGHFRRFSADVRAAGLGAAFRHPFDDRFNFFRHLFSAGDIIEEIDRLRSLDNDVVHAHRHAVDADRVMLVHHKSDLQFRAHSVRSGNQDRFLQTEDGEIKQSPETADSAHHSGTHRLLDMFFYSAYGFITGLNIHSRLFISFGHRKLLLQKWTSNLSCTGLARKGDNDHAACHLNIRLPVPDAAKSRRRPVPSSFRPHFLSYSFSKGWTVSG